MKYENIKEVRFLRRPNRFIAEILVDGKSEICHVKNTGRCRELLVPDAKIYVQEFDKENRKTKYDLIAVKKGERLINMDSQAPNKVFLEWLQKSDYFGKLSYVKPECKYKNSRFDFYVETEDRKIFIEIKGVTLENGGVVSFPDAPTQRGLKHINELSECIKDGYEAYIFFIVQMKNVLYFEPNRKTHPEFADALIYAKEKGVEIRCLDCFVEPDMLKIKDFVDIRL